ncbi:MAG: hypothetical protein PHF19_04030 [Synergistales bacterium]|jgi:hypothetical protein|nr:hypothetical protein [Synergistales bacterium]
MKSTRKLLASASALFLIGLLLSVASPLYAGAQDFVVVNRTGVTIYGLYVSPSDTESWEENLIEDTSIPDGGSLEISFSGYDSSEAHWDVMVTDENDDSLIWEDINLLKYGRVVLHFDGERAWADLE